MAHRNRWFPELKDCDFPVRYVNVYQRLPSISIVMIDLPDRFDDEFLMFFWLSFHYVQLYPNTPTSPFLQFWPFISHNFC